MGKVFLILLAVFAGAVLFALLGESLPEGSMLRRISDGLRSVGRGIGDAFGGGYGLLPGNQ